MRLTLRTRPFWRSSPDEEMASWLRGGVFERARFTSWPSPRGDVLLFDMMVGRRRVENVVNDELKRKLSMSMVTCLITGYVHQLLSSHHNKYPRRKKNKKAITFHNINNSTPLRSRPSHSIPSSLANINTKPYDQRRSRADRKQEREPLPIILRLVDDCLDNVRPNHGRSAVGKTKQAEELRHTGQNCG